MTVKNYFHIWKIHFYSIEFQNTAIHKKTDLQPRQVLLRRYWLYNEIAFVNSANRGRILENFVYMELKRKNKEIFYYRAKKNVIFWLRKK